MPAGSLVATWIFIAANALTVLAGSVYPFVSVMRTARAQPRALRWLWALATLLPGLVCMALMPSKQFVALALNWLVWLVFLWRARALTWRMSRPYTTGTLAAIAVLAAGFVGHALWTQHDSNEHMPLASARAASS